MIRVNGNDYEATIEQVKAEGPALLITIAVGSQDAQFWMPERRKGPSVSKPHGMQPKVLHSRTKEIRYSTMPRAGRSTVASAYRVVRKRKTIPF
jgi:hypothetical protein